MYPNFFLQEHCHGTFTENYTIKLQFSQQGQLKSAGNLEGCGPPVTTHKNRATIFTRTLNGTRRPS
jgi:hypothetical protein